MPRKRYKKLFRDHEIAERCIEMINSGYTYRSISEVLICDHTSVLDFKLRKEKEGVFFKKFAQRGGMEEETKQRFRLELKTVFVDAPGSLLEKVSTEENPSLSKKNFSSGKSPKVVIEKINKGKKNYAAYLRIYKQQIRESTEERMKQAKKTIDSVRKKQKDQGYGKEYDLAQRSLYNHNV